MHEPDQILPPIDIPRDRPIVVTIGNFDAVHKGHRALIDAARSLATRSTHHAPNFVIALAFHPHPAAILRPGTQPPAITSWERRERLLRAAGADAVAPLTPRPALLGLEPHAFLDAIARRYRIDGIVEGHDFHFGKARAGTPEALVTLAEQRGIASRIVEPVEVALNDQSLVVASSTITRWLLAHSRVADAARILTRPHEVAGRIVRGDRLGRTIGIPTANLSTEELLPADGVYAGYATLESGRRIPAAIHIGPRSTVDAHARTCEAHLFEPDASPWQGPACTDDDPEYGWPINLAFISWLRDQARFESLDALVEQIRRDITRAAPAAMHAIENTTGDPVSGTITFPALS